MLPTPYTVVVRRWSAGQPDAHGVAAGVWSAGDEVRVHAVAYESEELVDGQRRDASTARLTFYCPAGVRVSARDRVLWGTEVFEVDGDSADWTHGPWQNSAAGVVFRARKVAG